jgi:hypothetical protein
MHLSSLRSFLVGLFLATSLWPGAASAQAEDTPASVPVLSVERVRGSFVDAGYLVDQAHTWSWTAAPVTTFQIYDQDPARGRVLMALVYPDAAAAETDRRQAAARDEALLSTVPAGYGPHLVPGYGPSMWRDNVALVQTSRSELDRIAGMDIGRDYSGFMDTIVTREPGRPSYLVDSDFQQALINSVVNL